MRFRSLSRAWRVPVGKPVVAEYSTLTILRSCHTGQAPRRVSEESVRPSIPAADRTVWSLNPVYRDAFYRGFGSLPPLAL